MTPKRDPRSTPKRFKTDIKIDLNFDAKTKRAGPGSGRRLWAGDPPQGAAPMRAVYQYTIILGTYTLCNGHIYPW